MHPHLARCVAPLLLVTLSACQKADSATPDDGAVELASLPAPAAGEPEESAPAPAVSAPEAEPILTAAIFEETVQGNLQDVLDCYAQAQANKPKLAGKLKANFVVDAEGTIIEVSAVDGSTLTDAAMLACIQTKAAAWDLPKPPKAPTNFTFPFELAPAG